MTEQLFATCADTTHLQYSGKSKYLLSVLDKIEKGQDHQRFIIFYRDLKVLKEDFFSIFRNVEAAGGLVLNRDSKILLIFRRGYWDMPKGKIEPGETKKQAALREVIEETGLEELAVVNRLLTTYHIYKDKRNRRVIKPSYWYLMTTRGYRLNPQKEEDIEKALWVSKEDLLNGLYEPMYSSIRLVLHAFLHEYS